MGQDSPFSTVFSVGTTSKGNEIRYLARLDTDNLLGLSGPRRRIMLPRHKADKWKLPIIDTDDGPMAPICGIRLVHSAIHRPEDLSQGGDVESVWRLDVEPFTDDTLRRYLATVRPTEVDRSGSEPRIVASGPSFHMGRAVMDLMKMLARLAPPVGAVVEIYYARSPDGQQRMDGIASANHLLFRRARQIEADNKKARDAWQNTFTGGLATRLFSAQTIEAQGWGPTPKRVPMVPPDAWDQEGEQYTDVQSIMVSATRVQDSFWRATYLENDRNRQSLERAGYQLNTMRRSTVDLSDTLAADFMKRRADKRRSLLTEDYVREFFRAARAA